MASFRRKHYQLVYNFAREALLFWESRDEAKERECVKIMYLCEDAIGQQSDFPEWAREAFPQEGGSQ